MHPSWSAFQLNLQMGKILFNNLIQGKKKKKRKKEEKKQDNPSNANVYKFTNSLKLKPIATL